MLENTVPATLVINGLPIVFLETCYIESVNKLANSQMRVTGVHSQNIFKIGSSVPYIRSALGNDSVVSSTPLDISYSINFWVNNQGLGLAFTDVLFPLLDLAKKTLDLPCQFFYGGFYMFMGYLENYTITYNNNESRALVSCNFKENIYRFFTEEGNSEIFYTQRQNINKAS